MMRRAILPALLAIGLISLAATNAQAGLLDRIFSSSHAHGPVCGCEPVIAHCGCEPVAPVCEPACPPRHRGLLHGLFHRAHVPSCDAVCGCEPVGPVCGCEPIAPVCEPACCPPPRRHHGLLHRLFGGHGCADPCPPVCGHEPLCGF